MKPYYKFAIIIFIGLFMLACVGGTVATSAPVAAPTEAPPTVAAPTEAPPVATSAVLGAVKLGRFYPGGKSLFTAKPGNIIVDMGVKVSNLTGSSVSVPWKNVYVVEKTGDAWFPFYGSYKESGKKIDPFSLGISDTATNGDDVITFNGDIYLRLIFIVKDNDPTTFVFGFDDSPLIELIKKVRHLLIKIDVALSILNPCFNTPSADCCQDFTGSNLTPISTLRSQSFAPNKYPRLREVQL
jgi:hypothetical protein